MSIPEKPVIIVGGGLAGLACALRLEALGIRFRLLEATARMGGRIKTDRHDGFLLDRGFQVLQTAYPEAQRVLDYGALNLKHFSPGAMVMIGGRLHTLADPFRQPGAFFSTISAPIGSIADKLKLLRLANRVKCKSPNELFREPESSTMQYLRDQGFSNTMIERFFKPFFGGVCLDDKLGASNRVFNYVLRMFTVGRAAVPEKGMEEIPKQLVASLPEAWLHTHTRVRHIHDDGVALDNGGHLPARAVVIATERPNAEKLLDIVPTKSSFAESCLYFACDLEPWHQPFLILNGEGRGPINNVVLPSKVSSKYAPAGKSLVSVVVLQHSNGSKEALLDRVRTQLVEWFGRSASKWEHLHTYEIFHALPDQSPPTPNPTRPNPQVRPGVFVCGEQGSLPGIQWALVSGRKTADAVAAHLEGVDLRHD